MGERVRVMRHDGRLLAAKEAGAAGSEGLRAEAAVLDRARVPGVVELVGVSGGEPPLLLTTWVGPRSLAEVPRPVDPDHAAALCLAVAGTLQRLHRAGIVHGAVSPSHVLLDAHGRPVLCGFGSAGSIGAPMRRPATGRPAGTDTTRLGTADDVAGLGRLLTELLGPDAPRGLRRPARRAAARWRALHALAVHAAAEDASARPSLSAMARSIRRAAPGARLPGAADTSAADPPGPTPARPDGGSRRVAPARRSRRRITASVPAALVVALVGATTYFGVSSLWSDEPTSTAGASASPAPGAATTTLPSPSRRASTTSSSAPSSTTTTTTTAPTSTSTSAVSPPEDLAGGTVVVHDGRRYAVGATGDIVVVAPWRCDGTPLPAVLRSSDGSISVFDGWAGPGGSAEARLVTTIPGATGLVTVPDGPGCAVLSVTGPAGAMASLTSEELG